MPDYVPPTHPWELTSVLSTLLSFSLFLLKPGGRLVFFMPSEDADYTDVDVPTHPAFKFISNSKQAFGDKWSRRLITLEKIGEDEGGAGLDRGIERCGEVEGEEEEATRRLEGLRLDPTGGVEGPVVKKPQFRERYFDAFRSREATPTSTPPSELQD